MSLTKNGNPLASGERLRYGDVIGMDSSATLVVDATPHGSLGYSRERNGQPVRAIMATTPALIAPDKLIQIPVIDVLDVDYYPSGKMDFVDTSANPTTCVGWEKQPGDPQARISLFTGRGLPVSIGMDSHVVHLVRDDRDDGTPLRGGQGVRPGSLAPPGRLGFGQPPPRVGLEQPRDLLDR